MNLFVLDIPMCCVHLLSYYYISLVSYIMFYQVMYGGRAIDSFDRRILTVYMDEYFGDFLFYTFRQFHFFRNKDVDYKIPPTGPKKVYVGQLLFLLLNVAH